jgi:hypothetical protein
MRPRIAFEQVPFPKNRREDASALPKLRETANRSAVDLALAAVGVR